MKYTYDFEFIEDGKTIEPISMGMYNYLTDIIASGVQS